MSLFYKDSQLHIGNERRSYNLAEIMVEQQGHPCYVYDLQEILSRFEYLKKNVFDPQRLQIHYAVKANANLEILRALKGAGAKADVVSGGEFARCLAAGFAGSDIIFSGVGKSAAEIAFALDHQVQQLNVESIQELERIARIAAEKKMRAPVALRMNPEVNPVTHPYITTGMSENKFGLSKEFLPALLNVVAQHADHLNLRGLTMHIGSQILQLEVFAEATIKLFRIYQEIEASGYPLATLDIGGGVGIQYNESDSRQDFAAIDQYAADVKSTLQDFPGQLLIEPGRIVVGRSGVLLCQVEYLKETNTKNFAIVNSGMHHLLRPALYQASHRILPVQQKTAGQSRRYDVVGPICESSDFLGQDRAFVDLQQGDFLAVCDAGAYGFAMASEYNAHGLPAEIVLR